MARKSNIDVAVILRNLLRIGQHPWIWSKLAKLEVDKRLFGLVHSRNGKGLGRRIRQASFRITDMCNLRCRTCGQWGERGFLHGKDRKELKQTEVPPARYMEIFADMVRNGHRPLVYFWGGEPMLYDGIVDVIEGASDLRLPVSIATNGTRIAASADRLVKAPLFLLQLSIDGPSADLHNRIRPSAGTGDNFKEINTALRRVNHARQSLGSNLPLIASLTVISRYNFRNLVDIYDTFRHKVDLFVFYLSWWIDSEQACSHEKDFKNRFGFLPRKHWGWVGDWKPDDYQMLAHQLEELRSRSRSWSAPPVTIIPPILGKGNLETYYTNHESRFGFDQCVSIYQAVEVNSNGDLSPCRDYHDFVVGNIKNATISQLWNAPEYRRFRKSLSTEGLMPVCSRCCGLMGY